MLRTIGWTLAAMALVGCQGQDEANEEAAAPAQTGEGPTPPASSPAVADGGAQAANSHGFSSQYTPLDLAACEVTDSESEEGQWAERTCPGYRGVSLFVDDGDGRFDIDAGERNEAFQSLGAFNNPPDTIEWRMKDGVPFAIIYRLSDATPEGAGRTVPMVERIGTAQQPGCTIAQVAGSAREANVRARQFADRSATGFGCTESQPATVGNAR